MRHALFALAGSAVLLLATVAASAQETPTAEPPAVDWKFNGPFGTYDRAALQRGFQVYTEVCSTCHSMNLVHYSDLEALGYTDEEIKAIAAQKQVDDINDQGEAVKRPARPADAFVAPFANEKAARAANNGALPPDQSVLVKAREGGPDYLHALLIGYSDPPAGVKMGDGMNYNKYFPGNHQIAMPAPLSDKSVTYSDGTEATLDQEARDVTAFLMWAAEPKMEERKQTGWKAILFLLVMTGFLYGAKRKIWAGVH